uniref:hypothetical protein n=1 Tax=Picosynechococcus sp. NKBG15041c TaxID=1407650 RepID=UPI000571E1E0
GIIYAIDDVGDLYWYQHDGWSSGTADWKGRNKVGNGVGKLIRMFSLAVVVLSMELVPILHQLNLLFLLRDLDMTM